MDVNGGNPAHLVPEAEVSPIKLNKIDNYFHLFATIHNFIYANDGLSPQEALNEFVKILFIKIETENKDGRDFRISAAELAQAQSGTASEFDSRITALFSAAKAHYPNIFDKTDRIILKPATLAFVVDRLQAIQLSGRGHDVKGIAFQKFIFSSQRGDRGQFFTPDPVIKMCVEFLAPGLNDMILDPAAGTGGFLLETLRYLKKHNPAVKTAATAENLHGVEISPTIARIARMRMILEGNIPGGLINTDSLSDLADLSKAFSDQIDNWSGNRKIEGNFDLILTNPPFGNQGKITSPNLLKDFNLAYKWSKNGEIMSSNLLNGQVPEVLFIERCLSLLKPGGRLAVVLPNGELENPSLLYVRKYIKRQADLLAVVALPAETFIPHGTGVKASVLFLRKKITPAAPPPKIFFARVTKIGYKADKNGTVVYKKDKRGNLIADPRGNYLVDEDISKIIKKFHHFQKVDRDLATKNYFTLNPNKLSDRFDFGFYNPDYLQTLARLEARRSLRLADVADIVKTRSAKLKTRDARIDYVELSDINTTGGEIVSATNLKVFEAPSRATYEIHEGEVITAVAGNSVGSKKHASAIVDKKYDGAVCTNGLRVLRPHKVTAEYLLLFLQSEIFLKQMFQLRTGAAIPAVSDADFANILIPMVSAQEQARVSKQVQKSLKLRQAANKLLEEAGRSLAQ